MGMGIYAKNIKGSVAGIEEIGNIESRKKMKTALKYERKISEREGHKNHKKTHSSRKNRMNSYKGYDYDDYDGYYNY